MFDIRARMRPVLDRAPNMAMGSSVKRITKTKVSPLLTLRNIQDKDVNQKPLVLFFEWLRAPPSAVDKYCDLYHNRGMDVLTIKGNLGPFLMPNKAVNASKALLEYLTTSGVTQDRPFLFVHSLSVGAYLYSVVIMEMERNKETYGDIAGSIRGQVFDSIVVGSLENMGVAIAIASNVNKVLEWTIRAGMATFFTINKSTVVPFYDEAINSFKNNFMKGPVLVLYSLNDPMAEPSSMEEIISKWNTDPEYKLMYKCWDKSGHAEHMRLHPNDYMATLSLFFKIYINQNRDTDKLLYSKL